MEEIILKAIKEDAEQRHIPNPRYSTHEGYLKFMGLAIEYEVEMEISNYEYDEKHSQEDYDIVADMDTLNITLVETDDIDSIQTTEASQLRKWARKINDFNINN